MTENLEFIAKKAMYNRVPVLASVGAAELGAIIGITTAIGGPVGTIAALVASSCAGIYNIWAGKQVACTINEYKEVVENSKKS